MDNIPDCGVLSIFFNIQHAAYFSIKSVNLGQSKFFNIALHFVY